VTSTKIRVAAGSLVSFPRCENNHRIHLFGFFHLYADLIFDTGAIDSFTLTVKV
jgi:hypothetical protein